MQEVVRTVDEKSRRGRTEEERIKDKRGGEETKGEVPGEAIVRHSWPANSGIDYQ